MGKGNAYVQFWARLTFETEHIVKYLAEHDDLTGAPWRPNFFYPEDARNGYMIFPIAKECGEFGFYTLDPEFWINVHQHRIKPGVEFRLGATREHRHAVGIVTRVSDSMV